MKKRKIGFCHFHNLETSVIFLTHFLLSVNNLVLVIMIVLLMMVMMFMLVMMMVMMKKE